MQGKPLPIIAGQTKQSQQPEKSDPALIAIATQVSFETLLTVIQSLTTAQKRQIYQLLGVELYPQPPQLPQAKTIKEKASKKDESKRLAVFDDDTQSDEEAVNTWLTARGYPKAE